MIDGTCCEICGMYFQNSKGGLYTHDVPTVCWDCWDDLDPNDPTVRNRAEVDTI